MSRLELMIDPVHPDDNYHRLREWERRNGDGGTVTVTAAIYRVRPSDQTILVDDTDSAVRLTLPAAETVRGLDFRYKLIGPGTNGLTVQVDGDGLIDGSETFTTSVQYTARSVHSDGTNYWNF